MDILLPGIAGAVMSLRKPPLQPPARIEAVPHNFRESIRPRALLRNVQWRSSGQSDRDLSPLFQDPARFCSGPSPTKNADESHDMYENAAAYGKFEEIDRNRKALNLI